LALRFLNIILRFFYVHGKDGDEPEDNNEGEGYEARHDEHIEQLVAGA
jgi:hypothetical protein